MLSEEPTLRLLLERVDSLERQNVKLKRFLGVTLAVVATALLLGQSAPQGDVVAMGKFTLKDKDGKDRITLQIDDNDRAVMRFQQKDGTLRTVLSADPSGDSYIQLNGINGNTGLTLAAVKDFGTSTLSLSGRNGKHRASLAVGLNDIPVFTMTDEEGHRRLSMAITPDGRGVIQTLNPDGKPIWQSPEGNE